MPKQLIGLFNPKGKTKEEFVNEVWKAIENKKKVDEMLELMKKCLKDVTIDDFYDVND